MFKNQPRGRARQNTDRGSDGLPNFVNPDAKAFMQKQDSRAKAARAAANAPPPAPPPKPTPAPTPVAAPRKPAQAPRKAPAVHETNGEHFMRQMKKCLQQVPCFPK